MKLNQTLTSEQVKKTVAAVKKARPVYVDILDFYGRIFDAQHESRDRTRIQPVQISEEMLAIKAREKFPLIEIKEFAFDETEADRLFVRICQLARGANPQMAATAETLLKTVNTKLKSKALFRALLDGNEALFENIADEFQIDKQVLGFITYNSLRPSLTLAAGQLSLYLKKDAPWQKGYCPICGSAPILSIFATAGSRSLICSFCWHEWPTQRVFCPFCENRDGKTLQYFFNDEEKELRVDVCEKCKKYIKTIDTRKTERMIYPPLEQIASLHLDYKAAEMGYASGVRLLLQI